MKLLTLIFALYILLLPSFPCSDIDKCKENSQTETANNLKDPQDHQNENDNCNPFCSCACCGQVFYPNFQLGRIASPKPVQNLKQLFFYTNISLSSDFFGNIWQPPKFS